MTGQETNRQATSKQEPTKWAKEQSHISDALTNPDQPVPNSIAKTKQGKPSLKRFNVYRNNVAISLIKLCESTFPVTRELVGEDFFATMARQFSAKNLPKSPLLFDYGHEFPGFIKAYPPANTVPYLADIAALEWARNTVFHGPDKTPLAIETLAKFPQEELPNLTFELHPTTTLLASEWPIVSIWNAHQTDDIKQAAPNLQEGGECALVIRPNLAIKVHAVSTATFNFMAALKTKKTFANAVASAIETDDKFDISAALAGLFKVGAVTAIHGT